jgi:hypothetical protein
MMGNRSSPDALCYVTINRRARDLARDGAFRCRETLGVFVERAIRETHFRDRRREIHVRLTGDSEKDEG